ncbi:hypothetical protein ACWJJH_13440 [Endozoicomonadaceae bacterium StTr2]
MSTKALNYCIDERPFLDICELYRQKALDNSAAAQLVFSNDCRVFIKCQSNTDASFRLIVGYPAEVHGVPVVSSQCITGEWVSVLGGRTARPYFRCPFTGQRAGKLVLGEQGFAHRSYYGGLYLSQSLNEIDQALSRAMTVKRRIAGIAMEGAITELPARPKGMHQTTYNKLINRYLKTIAPLVRRCGSDLGY